MGKAEKPRVSVVIPCFNLGSYLDETVESVLRQTEQPLEIVIVNPGSTDPATVSLLEGYSRSRATVLHTGRKTAGGARNFGIARARGEYICCLDADDLLESACLETCARALDGHPEAGVATFWYRTFGALEGEARFESATLTDFLVANCGCTAAVFRREAWEAVGGYDEELSGYEDWDFWISILESGWTVHLIKQFLFRYREREEGKHRRSDSPGWRAGIMRRIIEKHRKSFKKNALEVIYRKDELLAGYWRLWQEAARDRKRCP